MGIEKIVCAGNGLVLSKQEQNIFDKYLSLSKYASIGCTDCYSCNDYGCNSPDTGCTDCTSCSSDGGCASCSSDGSD